MGVENSVIEQIRARTSQRVYDPRPLPPALLEKLQRALDELGTGPFGNTVHFKLLQREGGRGILADRLPTYGFIQGASAFIVGQLKRETPALEDFGYLLERFILFATEQGLGTCWLGGAFSRKTFNAWVEGESSGTAAQEDLIIPAVVSIGFAQPKERWTEAAMAKVVQPRSRKPWSELFHDSNFAYPLSENSAGQYAVPLEMVRLAPSASNRQPWRIVKDAAGGGFHFYLRRDTGRAYRLIHDFIQSCNHQRTDLGIAMLHFELAARELGLQGRWEFRAPGIAPLPENTSYLATWVSST